MRCPEHFKNTCSKYVLANSSYFDGLLSKYQHGFRKGSIRSVSFSAVRKLQKFYVKS